MKYIVVTVFAALLTQSIFAADPPANNSTARGACKGDVQKLCPDVKPGGGRIIACLKENRDKVSVTCKTQLEKMRDKKNGDNDADDAHSQSPDK